MQVCIHVEWISVSLGPAARCCHGKKSDEKLRRIFCAWLTAGGLSSEDPAKEGPDVKNCVFQLALCAKQTMSSVLLLVMFHFPSNLLGNMSFGYCMSFGWQLCHKLTDHVFVGLSLGALFYYSGPCASFVYSSCWSPLSGSPWLFGVLSHE